VEGGPPPPDGGYNDIRKGGGALDQVSKWLMIQAGLGKYFRWHSLQLELMNLHLLMQVGIRTCI
jgi:hypothetical protein